MTPFHKKQYLRTLYQQRWKNNHNFSSKQFENWIFKKYAYQNYIPTYDQCMAIFYKKHPNFYNTSR